MRSCKRVIAQDGRCRDLVDEVCDHALVGDGGEPVTDEAVLSLDVDQATRHRGRARRADERNLERHVDRRSGDLCDFHETRDGCEEIASWRATIEIAMLVTGFARRADLDRA
jgi:hypothetical protein